MPSTTCSLFWVNSNSNVVTGKVTDISAQCDNVFTTCTFPTSKPNGFAASEAFSCTGNLMFPTSVTSKDRSGYLCYCGSEKTSLPDPKLFSCTDICYKLDESQKCSFITLEMNSNPTFMDNGKGKIKDSECSSLLCGTGKDSQVCTDGKKSVQYTCNNQLQSDATQKGSGYVCNCEGPAQIPNGFGGTGTKDECSAEPSASASASATSSSNTASSSATGTATNSTSASSSSTSASAGAANKNAASATATISPKNLVGLMGATLFILGLMG